MSATIEEYRLGETPWLVVTGERVSAFRLLGKHHARSIQAIVKDNDIIDELRERTSSLEASAHLTAVRENSRRTYPDQWSELAAMAEGAKVPLNILVLLNLRGDIGAKEEFGCTDLAFRDGDAVFLAHNEDGGPEFEAHCTLLTLRLDGEPAVTAWWYPGFLPSNAFCMNEYGLVWGMDNIRVSAPANAPGRHFVGRALQRCRTIEEVTDHLRDRSSAGGFAYNIGQVGHPDAILVEAAAGQYASRSTEPSDAGLLWHTNHLRFLPSDLNAGTENSMIRAQTADTWTIPRSSPVDWCLQQLAYAPMPQGVCQDVTQDDGAVTYATFVVDLTTGTLTIVPRNHEPISISAQDFVAGRADRQTLASSAVTG
ncbi:C45 family autoproteolytic acyltransferase/hydolase [Pedococcus sp. P5_B7]